MRKAPSALTRAHRVDIMGFFQYIAMRKGEILLLGNLSRYYEPILAACFVFPLVAALFTIPFMVINYRKYGGIALMRVLVVYSFILYSMCAFLLTVLPLPTRTAVAAMAPRLPRWVPFTDLTIGLQKAGVLASGGWHAWANWRAFLHSSDCFQIAANVVMQVPLGFYLRYYFRCSLKKTLLIGFLISLFYETTQLTGLWFIYPQAYRLASVDDLITNTLGALIGYGITPLLALLLPSREQIDRISYRKGEHLTLIRRMLAAVLDLMALGVLTGTLTWFRPFGARALLYPPLCFLAYFVLIPRFTGGCTAGQALLRLRVIREGSAERPTLRQLFIRNVLLYVLEPLLVFIAMGMLLGLAITLTAEGLDMAVLLFLTVGCSAVLLAIVWFFLHTQLKWNTLPHGHLSHTAVVKTDRRSR